jgi:ATP-binding cassette subfamily G (WHITE) protein 2 (SNQ2)
MEQPTPHTDELPGGWIETPADPGRAQSYTGTKGNENVQPSSIVSAQATHLEGSRGTYLGIERNSSARDALGNPNHSSSSSPTTAVPTPDDKASSDGAKANHVEEPRRESVVSLSSSSGSSSDEENGFVAVKPASSTPKRPRLQGAGSKQMTEDDLFRALSQRRTNTLRRSETDGTVSSSDDEQEEINRLMSRMFGRTRQAASEEEKTRHLGVVFKNLTVKGMGVGAALQPSVGDIFLSFPRFLKNLVTRGPRKAAGKPPVRTILHDCSGTIKPGEMLLVLGRPGAGCSTFLKVLGNQRFGYEEIIGDVEYGGTDAEEMRKKFRSEVLYNPEDDFHYATLKVKDTLRFALSTKTPGKASRNEGESRKHYVNEFLRVVSKLFWIEHTMDTKVGNELIRGVSGGEKKRVSIAEAMITKVSVSECALAGALFAPFRIELF